MNARSFWVLVLLWPMLVFADGHIYSAYAPAYLQECAGCHVAYPPELMTAPGWKQIMGQLDRHFGSDASLDAKNRDSISTFLAGRAATRSRYAPSEPTARLSRTTWFVHEHGELPAKPSKAMPAASQCESCHTEAARGDFSERRLTLPAGWRRGRD